MLDAEEGGRGDVGGGGGVDLGWHGGAGSELEVGWGKGVGGCEMRDVSWGVGAWGASGDVDVDVEFDVGHLERSGDDDCVVVCFFVVGRGLVVMMAWCLDGETILPYW